MKTALPDILTLEKTVAPTGLAVSLDEVKDQCRIASNDHDTDLSAILAASVDAVESYLGRQLLTATYTASLYEFPGIREPVFLPRSPVQSVTSVVYLDTSGSSQSFADFTLVKAPTCAYIVPDYGTQWPSTLAHEGAENVTVTFEAGFGDASADVPETIRRAILLLAGDLFENRELAGVAKVTQNRTAEMLLNLYRIPPVS